MTKQLLRLNNLLHHFSSIYSQNFLLECRSRLARVRFVNWILYNYFVIFHEAIFLVIATNPQLFQIDMYQLQDQNIIIYLMFSLLVKLNYLDHHRSWPSYSQIPPYDLSYSTRKQSTSYNFVLQSIMHHHVWSYHLT